MDERLAESECAVDAYPVLGEVEVLDTAGPAQNSHDLVRTIVEVILWLFEIYFTVLHRYALNV